MSERLFEPFLDPVDAVLCVPADSHATAIEQEALPYGLRFPLFLDRTTPLCEQVASSPFAPASSRYGPFCDNITGMNWEMPDGRRVRVGERVVKSTTGYDLQRFLLGSGGRYGRATDYVLRLRPACDISLVFRLDGEIGSLRSAISALLRSSWMHWFDSVDLVVEKAPFLRIAVHCPAQEATAYRDFLSGIIATFALSLEASPGTVSDGCPDLVVKTSPEFVIDTALDLAKHPGAKCVAFCYCGVVHVYLPGKGEAAIREIARPLESALHATGGHWQSRHVRQIPSLPETAWLATLRKEWNIP
jgi:hypothetical protein